MSTYQVRTLEEADQIIREHERKTKTVYALLRSTKNFGCVDIPDCVNEENEVTFETVGVPYCGSPFYVAGMKILQCQSLRGRGPKKKKECQTNISGGIPTIEVQKPKVSKKRKAIGRTHQKLGCSATALMKEVIYYPEFQVFDHSKNTRMTVARHLKDILKSKAQVQKDRIIYITVPCSADHFGHSIATHNIVAPIKNNVQRLYVKNDFYGHNEPGNSKRVYYPIKQEKVDCSQLTKRLKVEGDDRSESRAREVREVLQSIMALTYKPGTYDAFGSLLKNLQDARQLYKQTVESTMFYTNEESIPINANIITTVSPSHQIISMQTSALPKDATWQGSIANQITSPQAIPGTTRILTVETLPCNVTATSNVNTVTLHTNPHNLGSDDSEGNGIYIETMGTLFN